MFVFFVDMDFTCGFFSALETGLSAFVELDVVFFAKLGMELSAFKSYTQSKIKFWVLSENNECYTLQELYLSHLQIAQSHRNFHPSSSVILYIQRSYE